MVAGIKQFAKSMPDMVEEKLQSDPAVAKQWEEVSTRFHYVFADPETAFRAMQRKWAEDRFAPEAAASPAP